MTTPSIVIIGNFDGVHRGHQAVLRQARALADEIGGQAGPARCLVLTFYPHPNEVLGRGAPPKLTKLSRRVALLRAHGADDVVVEPFTMELAGWSPSQFARDLLVGRLGARAAVVGENFRFGHKRAGDFAMLRTLGKDLGFEAVAAEVVGDEGGAFSSTRVRDAVLAGDVERAAAVLSRPHALTGTVVAGDRRGRTIGFPTANLDGVEEMLPAHGVYAVRVTPDVDAAVDASRARDAAAALGASMRGGVANIGVRPTVDGASLRIEAHVFDFQGDLYGAPLRVELVARLRGEQKFAGVDELRAQIARDAEAARRALADAAGL